MKIKKMHRLDRLNLIPSIILAIVCFFWLYPFFMAHILLL